MSTVRTDLIYKTYRNKDFAEIDIALQYDKNLNEEEKNILKLLLKNNISVASRAELIQAKKLANLFIKNDCTNKDYYEMRLEKIQNELG